jgi:hypothetical protein
MKTLLFSLMLSVLAHAQTDGIKKVLGPVGENIAVAHYQSVRIYNKNTLELVKEISKIDPIIEIAASPTITVEKDLVLMTAVNKVYVLDKNGNELSSAQVKLGRIQSPAVKLTDGRFAIVSGYQIFGPPSVYITFFKLNGTKIKADGHIKIKDMVAIDTSNEDVLLEAGEFFYFLNGRGELIQVSKRGKVKNLTEGMGYINSEFAKTTDNKIVFTLMEKPEKLFVSSSTGVSSMDLPFSVGMYSNDIHIMTLPNGNIALQGGDHIALLDSRLNILKTVDLKPIKSTSMVIQMKVMNSSLISLTMFGFFMGTDANHGQGVLLMDHNLEVKHNLIKQDGSFTPLDAGTISDGILYAGDHKNKVQKFELK